MAGVPKRQLEEQLVEARMCARLFWRWCLWLDHEMNAAYCAADLEDLEALRVGDDGKYEEWRLSPGSREAGLAASSLTPDTCASLAGECVANRE